MLRQRLAAKALEHISGLAVNKLPLGRFPILVKSSNQIAWITIELSAKSTPCESSKVTVVKGNMDEYGTACTYRIMYSIYCAAIWQRITELKVVRSFQWLLRCWQIPTHIYKDQKAQGPSLRLRKSVDKCGNAFACIRYYTVFTLDWSWFIYWFYTFLPWNHNISECSLLGLP